MPLRFTLTAIAILSLSTIASAADWPRWRGPNRDGKSAETGVIQNFDQQQPKLLWIVDGMGKGYASVSIADGKLYTTGNTGKAQQVVCVDAKTGDELWSTPVTDSPPQHSYPGSRCTPTIDDGHLYVVTSDGSIVCLTTAGKVVWKKSFKQEWGGKMMSGWGYSESPLVDGDSVLCTPGGREAMMVKLNKRTGKEEWRSNAPTDEDDRGRNGAGYSSIVISHGAGVKQYVQMTGRGLIGVRASDGRLLWQYSHVANPTANIPTPIPIDDYVFTSTGYKDGGTGLVKLVKVDGTVTADEIYYHPASELQNHHGGMIHDGDYIYFGHAHGQGYPACVEWKTGKVLWVGEEETRPRRGSAAIMAIDGQIIYRYQDGTLSLVSMTPKSYQLKGRFTPEFQQGKTWAHPVVVDGRLYLREQDKLMCYDFRAH